MLERYHNIGGHLRLDPEGTLTSYADAQATIADLQGQLKALNSSTDNAIASMRKTAQEAEFRAIQAEQRVGQLEAIQAIDLKNNNEYREKLATLQADHATLLGLVRKITPSAVVAARNYIVPCYCKDKNASCTAHGKYYVDRAVLEALDGLLAIASLPAPPAQGGA